MRLPTFLITPTILASTPVAAPTGPDTCFVCGDPSDSIAIAQLVFLVALSIPLNVFSHTNVQASSTLGRTFIAISCLSYLALTIHATFKFFLDDSATSQDGPRTFRRGFIYGLTKGFWVLGPAHYCLWIVGVVCGVMWWRRCGIYEEVEEVEEVSEVSEETPLMRGMEDSGRIGDAEEGRFRVLLKGQWREGAGAGGYGGL